MARMKPDPDPDPLSSIRVGITAGSFMGGRLAAMGAMLRRGIDLILPPRCYGCGALVDRQGALCAACWGGLRFITDPRCHRCGYPFEYAMAGNPLCGACLAGLPLYDRGLSALVYDDASRSLILAYKRADRTELAAPLALLMARAGGGLLADADLLLPVPLHHSRLFSRRFNQSALLARALSRQSGIPHDPTLLVRVKRTKSMGGLNRSERMKNVRKAFALGGSARSRAALSGRRVILVDDVYTTGATVNACARVLRKAGVAHISVLTVARVLSPAHQ
ncbi:MULTISPECIES: ComF family protein [unclassified Iodidimonas]|uniref:ComF family protein n=1 Tax=unclassified Iodidimonas TaxID=2626145 RepID=UPI002482ABD6|nr:MULTISPECIES: ComF family protein [unclassified Iodidimonas]